MNALTSFAPSSTGGLTGSRPPGKDIPPTSENCVVPDGSSVPFPSWMPSWLAGNPYFSAGFGLAGLGMCMTFLRSGIALGRKVGERRLLATLEISNRDPSYEWVTQWLIRRSKHSRHLALNTKPIYRTSSHQWNVEKASFHFIPSIGNHYIRYGRTPLLVTRSRTDAHMVDNAEPFETVKITAFSWQRSVFQTLLRDAAEEAFTDRESLTSIYRSFGQEWRLFGDGKRIRPFESVLLTANLADRLLYDVKDFIASSQWYIDRGIPYRRGYLLYGPPGCGKSSFVMALAGSLQYSIAVLNLTEPTMTDDRLQYLLATVPKACIVLLEDIDAVLAPEEIVGTKPGTENRAPFNPRTTLSGLLNALDGVVATEERIVFMTTNRMHKLPSALIRPGRVDIRAYIGLASYDQYQAMYLRFFPDEPERSIQFADALKDSPQSMAELQSFFMHHKDDAVAALDYAKKVQKAREEKDAEAAASASPTSISSPSAGGVADVPPTP